MPVDILVPPLSQTMDSLVLVSWLKKTGDSVQKGEPLFTVETDKATLEVEAPASGFLGVTLAGPGDEIKVRSVIGTITLESEPVATKAVALATQKEAPVMETIAHSSSTSPMAAVTEAPTQATPGTGRLFASPRARWLARQQGIRIEDLPGRGPAGTGPAGTGPGGAVIARDVQAYLNQQSAPGHLSGIGGQPRVTPLARRMAEAEGLDLEQIVPSKPGAITKADVSAALQTPLPGQPATPVTMITPLSSIPLTLTRRTIARRLQESHLASVAVTYMREVDVTRLVKLRKRILQHLPEGTVRPTITDFMVFLTCKVLANHPEFNATFDGETLLVSPQVHLALAVDTARGLVAPVIFNASTLGLAELARLRRDLVERALEGALKPEELGGGTFTLTNLGASGVDFFTPVINPPQVAILGVGRIREVPAVHKGKVRPRQHIGLALTCDHRTIDGAPAARFLTDLATLIENPDLLWM